MGPVFTEIIFPKKPKPAISVPNKGDYKIDYWVVGEPPYKSLYVQCPICYFSFRLATVLDEETLDAFIKDYPQIYFNSAIRDCPDREHHGKEQWHQTHLLK